MVTFHQLANIVANAVVTRIKRSIIPDSEVWAAGSRTIRSFAVCSARSRQSSLDGLAKIYVWIEGQALPV